jgi:hypothetical protein
MSDDERASIESKIEDELKRLHTAFDDLVTKGEKVAEIGMADLMNGFACVRDLVGLMRHGAPVPPKPEAVTGVVIPAGNLPKV